MLCVGFHLSVIWKYLSTLKNDSHTYILYSPWVSCTLSRCVFAGRGRALAALFINLTANGKEERFCWCLGCFSCYEQWWHIGEGVRWHYLLLSVSPSDSCFAICFYPRLMLSFSMSAPAVLNMQRIENVTRIMAPLFCKLFFYFSEGKL